MTSNDLFSIESIKRAIVRTPDARRFRKHRGQQRPVTQVGSHTILPGNGLTDLVIPRSDDASAQGNVLTQNGRSAVHGDISAGERERNIHYPICKEERIRAITRIPAAKRFKERQALFCNRRGRAGNTFPEISTSFATASTTYPSTLQSASAGFPLVGAGTHQNPTNFSKQGSHLLSILQATRPPHLLSLGVQIQGIEERDDILPDKDALKPRQYASESPLDQLDIDLLRLDGIGPEIPPNSSDSREALRFSNCQHEGRNLDSFVGLPEGFIRDYQLDDGGSIPGQEAQEPGVERLRRGYIEGAGTGVVKDLKLRKSSKQQVSASTSKKKSKPNSKRQRSSNKRSLPVDELQISPWSSKAPLDISDGDQGSELSEDSISEFPSRDKPSTSMERLKRSKSRDDLCYKLQKSNGFGPIKISQFKMPKAPSTSARGRSGPAPSYCNGFIGKELETTGRIMLTRRPYQNTLPNRDFAIRLRELKLIPEKTFELEVQRKEPKRRSTLRKPQSARLAGQSEAIDATSDWFGCSSKDGDQGLEEEIKLQIDEPIHISQNFDPQETRRMGGCAPVLHVSNHTRPLKRKVTFDVPTTTAQEQSTPTVRRGSMLRRSNQIFSTAQSQVDPLRGPSKGELEVSQLLMMVSTPRRVFLYSDDDASSDTGTGTSSSQGSSEDENIEELNSEELSSASAVEEGDEYWEDFQLDKAQDMEESEGGGEPSTSPVDAAPVTDAEYEEFDTILTNSPMTLVPHLYHMGQIQEGHRGQSKFEVLGRGCRGSSEYSMPVHHVKGLSLVGRDDSSLSQCLESPRRAPSPVETTIWRPRRLDFGTTLMKVDEDIFDDPSPSLMRNRPRRLLGLPRKPSLSASQLHAVAKSQLSQELCDREGQNDRQASIELGDSQLLFQEFNNKADSDPQENYIHESQLTYQPSSSYFEATSQALSRPTKLPNVRRIQSMPAQSHQTSLHRSRSVLPEISSQNVCPIPSLPRLLSRVESTPSSEKSLMAIARQASLETGTFPGSARRRMVSLPFNPPFKR